MEQVGSIEYDARINTSDFSKDASKVERDVDNLASNIEKSGGRGFRNFSQEASNSFNSVAGGIAALAKVATGLLFGGALGAGVFIKQASELQSMTASFEAMTGSAEEARKVLSQLNKFSFDTAFSSEAINATARTLLASGLAVNDLGKRMQQIGDIAGATGADLGRLTLPLSQALARGKLQTQDFYQILDSGAGKLGQVLREELAKRGIGDFTKAMEEGKVTSEILFDVVEKSAQKGGFAFEGAIKQSRTFNGQMSNLMETISNVALNILGINRATGEIDPNGVFAKLSLTVQDATKWLNENKEQIKDVAKFIMDNAIPAITALAVAYGVAKVAAIGFSIAASANPIGIIIIAIAALIAGLVFLQLKFNIFGKAWDFIKDTWNGAIKWFKDIFDGIAKVVSDTWNGIAKWFEDIWNKISGVFEGAIGWFNDNWKTLLAILLWPFALAAGFIIEKWGAITAFFQTVWDGIVAIFSPIVSFFTDIFTSVSNTITSVWNGITEFFTNVWNNIKNIFSAVGSYFSSIFTSASDNVKTAFSPILDFFKGLWNSIVSIFTKVGTAVGNAVGGAFKSVMNTVLSSAGGIINGFIDVINGAIKTINKIPGVKVPSLGKLAIPQLADGGIVMPRSGGVLANIAEAGKPEAVIPLDKLDEIFKGNGAGTEITNNIGEVNISSDTDGEKWLRKLTQNQEIVGKGLTPQTRYA
jgi:tape measure domain-containing protein